ncbi:unnamed protein product [Vitrella brassicaformis CCMP3155]|uniref:Uncharacterized protein n=1 Tax=Vitrella brassicaformis (strain CCMP3155) TaxID=1169540 RepID=A0A0G4FHQ0_VITBC|nr:unnamed protein product [Vitrella brassicaformis CCMP3155]|eukprot:CEM13046.1 unnamed protein product [Vitrella brassicaformis CCMP3155]
MGSVTKCRSLEAPKKNGYLTVPTLKRGDWGWLGAASSLHHYAQGLNITIPGFSDAIRPGLLAVCKWKPDWVESVAEKLPHHPSEATKMFIENLSAAVERLRKEMEKEQRDVCVKSQEMDSCPPEFPLECTLGYRCATDRTACIEDGILKVANSSRSVLTTLGYLFQNPLPSGIGTVVSSATSIFKKRAAFSEFSLRTDGVVHFLEQRHGFSEEDARHFVALEWAVEFSRMGLELGYNALFLTLVPSIFTVGMMAGSKAIDLKSILDHVFSGPSDDPEAETLFEVVFRDERCWYDTFETLPKE